MLSETTVPIKPESCQRFYAESNVTLKNDNLPIGTKGSHPWVATFRRIGSNRTVCSGTILDEFHILTAASVANSFVENIFPGWRSLKVVIGDLDTNEQDEEQEFDIDSVHIHPLFEKLSPFDNDIAVVKLKPKNEAKGSRAGSRL